jgi:RHS repeat-associated protein
VTPILRYDPLGRLIRTDMPNGTLSRVEFDPWQQATWDENDTVLQSRWYVERGSPNPSGRCPSGAEARAAWLAARHANTPTIAHLDTLGRTFLTIADNGGAEKYGTRVELDIEGNQRAVIDARGLTVMRHDYDMLGGKVFQRSMDAGDRWVLNNVAGHPIRGWDSRNHIGRTTYDQLQRPTQLFVREGSSEELVERTVYGEPLTPDPTADAEAKRLNLRGKVWRHFDGAGVVTSEAFDFKGNLLRSTRQFAVEYRRQLDWSASPAPALHAETFTGSTTYDALNRPVTQMMPDRSVIRPVFNEANLLERVSVNLRGAATDTVFVNDIDYDAKGQRQFIEYGITDRSGAPSIVRTEYDYDPLTFRLTHLTITRTTDGRRLQDLSYTYDAVGNITAIRDDAQQTIYFRNSIVEPGAEYEYDAIYRLISATGREHLGQNAVGGLSAPRQTDHDDSFRTNLLHPGDGNAMGNYTERYEYDAVGNILRMIHAAGPAGGWTRHYSYASDSNRLLSTSLPGDPTNGPYSARYTYDEHGNMIAMPHLPAMEWDFKDQLHSARRQVITGGGTGEKTYFVYDSAGQRTRKITERPGGSIKNERIYLGGFEIYREHRSDSVSLERETLHVMDNQRRIAMVETKTVDASAPPLIVRSLIRYQLDNHLGSPSVELDSVGEIVSNEEYYPFGSTSYQAVRNGVEVSPKRYRYTGKEQDEETGLYYHGARYYAPCLARWIAVDPLLVRESEKSDYQSYVYVNNRPVIAIDPNGEFPWIVVGIAILVGVLYTGDPGPVRGPDRREIPHSQPGSPTNTLGPALAMTAVSVMAPGGGDVIARRVLPEAVAVSRSLGAHMARGAVSGTVVGGTFVAAQDVLRGQLSSAGTYAGAAVGGAALGAVGPLVGAGVGRAGTAITRRLRPRPTPPPRPAPAPTPTPPEPAPAPSQVTTPAAEAPTPPPPPANPVIVIADASDLTAWQNSRNLGNPSSGPAPPIISLGPNQLANTTDATLIAHGVTSPVGNEAQFAQFLGPHGITNVSASALATRLIRAGWRGGRLTLGVCNTGCGNRYGDSFMEELSAALRARGAPTTVRAPLGEVEYLPGGASVVGDQVGPNWVPRPAADSWKEILR